MPKVRIALITENYPPEKGGIAVSAQRLGHSLCEQFDVHVFRFPRGNPDHAPMHSKQIKELTLHTIAPFVNGWSVPSTPRLRALVLHDAAKLLAKVLDDEQIQLVIGFGLQNAGLIAHRASQVLNLPLIQAIRGNDVGRNAFDGQRRTALELALRSAHTVVAVNQWIHSLLKFHFPWLEKKLVIIHNGTESIPISEEKSNQELSQQSEPISRGPIIGFIGDVREKKGPYVLQRIVDDFIRQYNGQLLIIGTVDLSHFSQIGWKGGSLDEQYTRITYAHDKYELRQLIATCDWVVFPSLDDGLANGLLEAMACARPVVCSSVFSDVVRDQIDGFLVSPLDPSAYISICRLLWNNELLRRQLGRAAQQRIQGSFGIEREKEQWNHIIKACLWRAGKMVE